jgi:hypothetical protein
MANVELVSAADVQLMRDAPLITTTTAGSGGLR